MANKLYIKNKNGTEYELDNGGVTPKSTSAISLVDIQNTLGFLKNALNQIKKVLNIDEPEIDNSGTDYTSTSDINISTVIESATQKQIFSAKSILMTDSQIKSTHVNLNSAENVFISNLNTSGTLPKKVSNAGVSIDPIAGEVEINGGVYSQDGYNAVEIGLNKNIGTTGSTPRNITIKDVDFSATLSNNAILIFNTADYAVINIENCHFASVSNVVRLSNRDNNHVTLNIKNCTIDKWDESDDWAGMIILEDYTNKTEEDILAANLFGPDKVQINIENCTGPYGKIVPVASLSTICGTKNHETQLIYLCEDYGNNCVPYSAERYPSISIK